ncbi:hypothetical protein ACH42_15910 [Endozoicomonas sp. (ex Bugula neritina AB1)]|nr:hypothetical protein ACH42_15910 [Endozoicomonas sp. (ex Bugula neritina AB1)]
MLFKKNTLSIEKSILAIAISSVIYFSGAAPAEARELPDYRVLKTAEQRKKAVEMFFSANSEELWTDANKAKKTYNKLANTYGLKTTTNKNIVKIQMDVKNLLRHSTIRNALLKEGGSPLEPDEAAVIKKLTKKADQVTLDNKFAHKIRLTSKQWLENHSGESIYESWPTGKDAKAQQLPVNRHYRFNLHSPAKVLGAAFMEDAAKEASEILKKEAQGDLPNDQKTTPAIAASTPASPNAPVAPPADEQGVNSKAWAQYYGHQSEANKQYMANDPNTPSLQDAAKKVSEGWDDDEATIEIEEDKFVDSKGFTSISQHDENEAFANKLREEGWKKEQALEAKKLKKSKEDVDIQKSKEDVDIQKSEEDVDIQESEDNINLQEEAFISPVKKAMTMNGSVTTQAISLYGSGIGEAQAKQSISAMSKHSAIMSGIRTGSLVAGMTELQEVSPDEMTASIGAPHRSAQINAGNIYSYGQIYGLKLNQGSENDFTGFDSHGYGLELGAFRQMNSEWSLGFLMGFQNMNSSFKENGGSMKANSYRFGPFASWNSEQWHLNTALTYGWSDLEGKRQDLLTGDKITSNPRVKEWNAYASLGYDIPLDHLAIGLTMTPNAELLYINSTQDAFKEKGQGDNLLQVESLNRQDWIARTGIQFSYMIPDYERPQELRAGIGYQKSFMDTPDIHAGYSAGSMQQLKNGAYGNSSVYYNLGYSLMLKNDQSILFDYLGSTGNSSQSHALSVTYEMKF